MHPEPSYNAYGDWNKLFGKKEGEHKVGGMEDFMTLIRVYFQAAMASDLGITNLAALPDLRVFKATLKVPTVNNKLGVGERSRCKKMLKEMYGMDDDFFKEIDQSLRKRCKKVQDAQTYLLQFQGFTQDIMMLTGNLMKFKLRLPGFMKKALYTSATCTIVTESRTGSSSGTRYFKRSAASVDTSSPE